MSGQRDPHARAARALSGNSAPCEPPADPRWDPSAALRTADAPPADRRDLRRFLGRLEVGVRARGVVGDVDHLGDLRDGPFERDLDPLPKRDVDLGAALAAATQLDIGGATANLEQVDKATVRRDRGIDLPVEDLLDASR